MKKNLVDSSSQVISDNHEGGTASKQENKIKHKEDLMLLKKMIIMGREEMCLLPQNPLSIGLMEASRTLRDN